ncbi:MAG: 50S ribosomal protein P1 [Thermoprotei archaeon]|nr:MAG: 50S ribosomal protein P1 [Thermoprotei archaeon]RLE89933.1 MAG: 50S ribosomal protein P1 [Thermoprotei archaeon]
MEYVYASLLLHYAGRPITEDNIKRVLSAAGIEVDDIRVKALVAALKEIDIGEAIKSAAVPVAPPIGVTAAPPAEGVKVEEEKKEEEKKEEKEEAEEEELAEGLAALFG